MEKGRNILIAVISLVISLASTSDLHALSPSTETFELYSPYWDATFDAAGYCDYFNWGPSPRHDYARHEMLSGEWAAAIYYDGISSSPKSMWLTDKFVLPKWYTNSDFQIADQPASWNDPSNLVAGNDTGHSSIANAQVEIDIDYEIVDLGEQGPNGEGGSPLSFGDFFVRSERYVLLQTYTITNITANSITGLEFYQMLHSHPADEYESAVTSVYCTTPRPDPLANYTPWNSVHTIGNFQYDITQWNDLEGPDSSVSHRDWIGFGTTTAPDAVENGLFEGHINRPPDGQTHYNIEWGSLNGEQHSYGEVAGAMGWFLGTLEPSESISITVAVMLGAAKPCEIPVAQWKLEENTGNSTYDSIGANNGTLIRSPSWVSGYSGNALQFAGNNFVALDYWVDTLSSDEVVISAWVKPATGFVPGNYYPIVTQYNNNQGHYLSLNGNYQPDFYLNPGCYATSPESIDTDWHLLMGTYDGEDISIYVDGRLMASTYCAQQSGIVADAYIGGDNTGQYFKGIIDEVEIYKCTRECLPECHKDYDDWVLLGKPDCWCTPYQCDGDADVADSGPLAYFRVSLADLNLIVANWQKQAGDPTLNPCADVDHKDSGPLTRFRVSVNDLNIVVNNWQKRDEDLPGDCADCNRGLLARADESEIDFDILIKQLEQIWLDPEVQNTIDQKVWDKIIKSVLKEARKQ